jgi:hypothetical protein
MAAVADLIEPAPLSRPEARRSAGHHSLFHAALVAWGVTGSGPPASRRPP